MVQGNHGKIWRGRPNNLKPVKNNISLSDLEHEIFAFVWKRAKLSLNDNLTEALVYVRNTRYFILFCF